ncbi:hypothetical protein NL676_011519 [Syzygium grande]|nr:hypothetical protein NL676_011519 [Syzygium grande]
MVSFDLEKPKKPGRNPHISITAPSRIPVRGGPGTFRPDDAPRPPRPATAAARSAPSARKPGGPDRPTWAVASLLHDRSLAKGGGGREFPLPPSPRLSCSPPETSPLPRDRIIPKIVNNQLL